MNEETFFELIEDDNFKQAPYLAKSSGVQIQDIELVPDSLIKELVSNSYEAVKAKLTKKKQKEIEEL